MDTSKGEYRFDDGAVAEYDQIKAQAVEKLRHADGFVLVCASWENDDDLNLVVTSATRKMDPSIFMALSCAEVAKLTKQAVMAAADVEEEE